MEKTCENCLFDVSPYPNLVVCIAGKRTREYYEIKTDCKRWKENTVENAKEQLKLLKEVKNGRKR